MATLLFVLAPALFSLPVLPRVLGRASLSAQQATFEQTVADLKSPDWRTRLKAARLLAEAGYVEGATPLAEAVRDPNDDVQLEAISGELSIFVADKAAAKSAEAAYLGGPFLLIEDPVPFEVLTSLLATTGDENSRVALDALYAFGALAGTAGGAQRRDLIAQAVPRLAQLLRAGDERMRVGALRVTGSFLAGRPLDPAVDPSIGDEVIDALNESRKPIQLAAMHALGRLRYIRAAQALSDLEQFYGSGEQAEAAFDALARIAQPSSRPLFMSGLGSRVPAFKRAAIEGLARLGDRSAAEPIQVALAGERDESVLSAARFSSVILLGASVDPIVRDLTRDKRRDQAFEYLVEIERARPRSCAPAAQDADARIRRDIADALAASADGAALPIVEAMASDPDAEVSLAARRAVARLRATLKTS